MTATLSTSPNSGLPWIAFWLGSQHCLSIGKLAASIATHMLLLGCSIGKATFTTLNQNVNVINSVIYLFTN